jgi:hypothetical protein
VYRAEPHSPHHGGQPAGRSDCPQVEVDRDLTGALHEILKVQQRVDSWLMSWRSVRSTSRRSRNRAAQPRGRNASTWAARAGSPTGEHGVLSYATLRGHALVGARIWVPAERLDDQALREVSGIPADVRFKTKPQLAKDIVADMADDATMVRR